MSLLWLVLSVTNILQFSAARRTYTTLAKVCGYLRATPICDHHIPKLWAWGYWYNSLDTPGETFHNILEAGCRDLLQFNHVRKGCHVESNLLFVISGIHKKKIRTHFIWSKILSFSKGPHKNDILKFHSIHLNAQAESTKIKNIYSEDMLWESCHLDLQTD